MTGIPNTVRRAGIYHFRRSIPMCLRLVVGRGELTRSLPTNDPVLAQSRSRRLYLLSEALIGLARDVPMLGDQQIATLVRRFYAADSTPRTSSAWQPVFGSMTPIAKLPSRITNGWGPTFERPSHAINSTARAAGLSALLEREGIPNELDDLTRAKMQQGILCASSEIAAAMRERFQGRYAFCPGDPVVKGPILAPAPSETAAVSADAEVPQLTGPLFSVRAEEFRLARNRRGIWDPQTTLQARKTYQLFREFYGDRPMWGYVREDAVAFKHLLSDLPANYGKAARFKDMSASDIVALVPDMAIARLAPRTIQRHLSALSALREDAIEQGKVAMNYSKNFKV